MQVSGSLKTNATDQRSGVSRPGANQALRDRFSSHRQGDRVGVTSVCSAHPLVLEAAARQVHSDGGVLLIEATSNQVDQYGGYTGMVPADFAALVHDIVDQVGLPRDRLVLGGDHLGPNRWRSLPARQAMDRAVTLVAAYARAGFTKIHLDCTMACAGDPTPLPGTVVAERAARLAKTAETVAADMHPAADLLYVIGSEVPVPGGAQETIAALTPTTPDAARVTMAEHRAAFADAGVGDAWERVAALVVQPGVEFDHVRVFDYDPDAASRLSQVVKEFPGLVFEAHSTDYQTRAALAALVRDHWAVLKVGPGLTFAMREALFALATIEDELIRDGDRSRLVEVLDDAMMADPSQWASYYEDEARPRVARKYSYSDRSRYYWPVTAVAASVDKLFENLGLVGVPLPMLSQHLPAQYARVRNGEVSNSPRELVIDHIRDVLRDYAYACGDKGGVA